MPPDGHPGPVDVEVAECHVVEAVHLLEAAEKLLVEALAGAVQRAVGLVVGAFWGRELLGHPVDRRRRGGDQAADIGGDGSLEDVEGGVHHDLDGETGLIRALGDTDGRLMEDDVDAGHRAGEQGGVAQVVVDDGDVAVGLGPGQVGRPAAGELVDDDDLGGPAFDELVGDRRADDTGTAGDEEALAGNGCVHRETSHR